jgi:hypothetical protein
LCWSFRKAVAVSGAMLITLVISRHLPAGKISFVLETADADKESRRSARLVWTVGKETRKVEFGFDGN